MTHEHLGEQIARHMDADGIVDTRIPRLTLVRWSQPGEPVHMLQRPALCIIAQGAKQVMMGDAVIAYGPASYLVASLDLPITGTVTQAEVERWAGEAVDRYCALRDEDAVAAWAAEVAQQRWALRIWAAVSERLRAGRWGEWRQALHLLEQRLIERYEPI